MTPATVAAVAAELDDRYRVCEPHSSFNSSARPPMLRSQGLRSTAVGPLPEVAVRGQPATMANR